MRWCFALFLLWTLSAERIAAQDGSVVSDLLRRMRESAEETNYAETIRLGRELGGRQSLIAMTAEQTISYRTLMAYALYNPDDVEPRVKEATDELMELVRMRPDAQLVARFRWPGLDSLLRVAKRSVFSTEVRPRGEVSAAGAAAVPLVAVVASREARVLLEIRAQPNGARVRVDSLASTTSGELRVRAIDGSVPNLQAGPHELWVTFVDLTTSDTIVVGHELSVVGEMPDTLPTPALDGSRLLPLRAPPQRAATIGRGTVAAALTMGVAVLARGEGRVRTQYGLDVRAIAVAATMAVATLRAVSMDKGRELPANAAANDAMRAAHVRAVQQAMEENRRRMSAYRVTLRVGAEIVP